MKVYIDKDVFSFSPQVWGLLTLTPITVDLHGSTKDAEMLGYLIPKFVEQASSIFGLDASNYVPCACMQSGVKQLALCMCLFVSKNVNKHNINVCGLACGYLNGAEVVSIF